MWVENKKAQTALEGLPCVPSLQCGIDGAGIRSSVARARWRQHENNK